MMSAHSLHGGTEHSQYRPQSRDQNMTSTFARIWIVSEVSSRRHSGISLPGAIQVSKRSEKFGERSHSIAALVGEHDEDVKGISCKFLQSVRFRLCAVR